MGEIDFTAIVLAAGKGSRMSSRLPKVLHPVAGEPMLRRVVNSLNLAGAKEVLVVLGDDESSILPVIKPLGACCFRQESPKGTAHAVGSVKIDNITGFIFICNGDHPLMSSDEIVRAIEEFKNQDSVLAVLTAHLNDPKEFGRVVKHQGELQAIVEVKDASQETLKIKEVNTGAYIVSAEVLKKYLKEIDCHNQQKEFYLTDLVALCRENNEKLSTIEVSKDFAQGVNTQMELAKVTQIVYLEKAKKLMSEGVTIIDPNNTYIEEDVTVGSSTVIYPGAFIKGKTFIGELCIIEPNVFIDNCDLASSVHVKAGSYLEKSKICTKAIIGPYAHLRPGSDIGEDCRVGNFVELKKTKMGARSKASHLSYLGDSIIGDDCNIGCGTVTVNYSFDKKKYKTEIGDNSFVGSGTHLVAPVSLGKNSFIACGTVITKEVPDGALAIGRSKQIIKENYKPKS